MRPHNNLTKYNTSCMEGKKKKKRKVIEDLVRRCKRSLTEKRTDSGCTYKISVWRSIVRMIEARSHRLLQGGITLQRATKTVSF